MRVPSPAARTTTVRGVVGGTIFIASVVGEKRVVARLGFEPRQTDSKSVVLPLHNLATQKHYSTNHLPDAKKCGDEFLGRVFVGSHSARRGRGGMPLSRTEHAEGAEDSEIFGTSNFTSHFRLYASYFVLRNLAACIFGDGAVGASGVEPSCCSEIGAGEVDSRQICAGKVGVGEIRASEIYMGKIQIRQICMRKISIAKVGSWSNEESID